ncbi:hypothetical protein [Selenomonas ruminis]|uniref:ATP-binding protein n=1 Tax=Selenomonas ruminis TaxID=2593411 RepID=A0A5D6VVY0_9FIRM|nr:hypothetical protein [Selenomonas sp. mPRGC5]TYZ20201.1 hypothetical protein FZ040_12190 [Selenomonas sp. mPRGC5]
MQDREIQHYHIQGYDAFFQEALPPIKSTLDKKLGDTEGHFAMAIVEAAQNAAMYARKSPEEMAMDIELVATETDITVKVTADTKDFDVLAYRENLGRMASDKYFGEMEWADYIKGTQKSRGYFTMLMAVECLYVDVTGKSVTLCAARPYHPRDISRKIKDIVPRFMLEQNGVIIDGEGIH